jgi:fibronectin type 3 domain-containing protein
MAAGTSTTLTASFTPTLAGTSSGTIAVTSNATNPALSIPLSGTGTTQVQHQVTLSWTASTSQVAGYKIYRASNPNGQFSVLNTGLINTTTYVDQTVSSGMTYYYYATAVDNQGTESIASNQVSATVP